MKLGIEVTFRLFAGPAWLIWVSGALAVAQTAGADCNRALELHRAGDLSAAAESYEKCLTGEPDRFEARSNLGVVYAALGKFSEAISQYKLAISEAPPAFAARLGQNLGLAYYKAGRFGDALEALRAVRAAQPPELKLDLLIADCYLQNGEPAKAVELLDPYETAGSGDKALAYVLGTALIRGGQVERGQKVIDRILRDGDSAESRFLLGVTAFTARDYPSAVRQLAGALAMNPELPTVQSFYGQALLATGDPDAAAKAFREELVRNPRNFESNLQLGEILKQRRAFEEAQPFLEQAAALRAQSQEAQTALAGLEMDRKHFERAMPLLESIVRRWPEDAGSHAQLAEAYASLGRLTDAKRERQLAAKFGAAAAAGQPSDNSGPKVGEMAPSFVLPELASGRQVSLDALRSGKPAVLLFGSYTCPNFRQQANVLNSLAQAYGASVPFLLIYIREAHTGDTWQSTINQREGVDWAPAKNTPEMQAHASSCIRKLKMHFPAVVDSVDGQVESQYAAWPSRLYVVGKKGRVVYRTRLSELDFQASAVEAAIREAARDK